MIPVVIIDREKCIGCGQCAEECIGHVISLESGSAEITRGCFQCGHCVAVCPAEAVRFEGDKYDMADVEPVGAGFGIDGDTMLHAIKTRRSIRRFKKECPSREVLEKVLEAGRFSPTASNSQNVSYIVFTEKTAELEALMMDELRKLEGNEEAFYKIFEPPMSLDRVNFRDDNFILKGAPAVIVTVSPHPVNAAIASCNMEMQAASMGLGALYVGYFTLMARRNQRLRDYLGLNEKDRVITCLALGWPDVEYLRTVPRKKAQIKWM